MAKSLFRRADMRGEPHHFHPCMMRMHDENWMKLLPQVDKLHPPLAASDRLGAIMPIYRFSLERLSMKIIRQSVAFIRVANLIAQRRASLCEFLSGDL